MRNIKITPNFISNPESSILIEAGNTKIICNVTLENNVPSFMKDTGKGWITAEYGMLPASTKDRMRREAAAGKVSGRTAEIQRMIGRALRSVVDLTKMNGWTAIIDCDVISADGGTRTLSITGAAVALYLAFENKVQKGVFKENPMKELMAAISVGIYNDEIVVDLDYEKDSQAKVDMNIVMTESGRFVEIQGNGEEHVFSREELDKILFEAEICIKGIIKKQKEIISETKI